MESITSYAGVLIWGISIPIFIRTYFDFKKDGFLIMLWLFIPSGISWIVISFLLSYAAAPPFVEAILCFGVGGIFFLLTRRLLKKKEEMLKAAENYCETKDIYQQLAMSATINKQIAFQLLRGTGGRGLNEWGVLEVEMLTILIDLLEGDQSRDPKNILPDINALLEKPKETIEYINSLSQEDGLFQRFKKIEFNFHIPAEDFLNILRIKLKTVRDLKIVERGRVPEEFNFLLKLEIEKKASHFSFVTMNPITDGAGTVLGGISAYPLFSE